MKQYLPTSVRWASPAEKIEVQRLFHSEEYLSLTGHETTGFLLLCDVEFPEEIKQNFAK